jgi:multicomponent Na+:H+ antiporter subunit G
MNPVLDIIGALFLLLGAMLCFAASVGLVRFPDVLTRMHAATKPQTLGLLFVVAGVAFSLQNLQALGILLLVAVLQLLTAPVAAHMVSRTAYRTGQVSSDLLTEDELADDLAAAGFHLVTGDEDAGESDGEGDSDGTDGSADDRAPAR